MTGEENIADALLDSPPSKGVLFAFFADLSVFIVFTAF